MALINDPKIVLETAQELVEALKLAGINYSNIIAALGPNENDTDLAIPANFALRHKFIDVCKSQKIDLVVTDSYEEEPWYYDFQFNFSEADIVDFSEFAEILKAVALERKFKSARAEFEKHIDPRFRDQLANADLTYAQNELEIRFTTPINPNEARGIIQAIYATIDNGREVKPQRLGMAGVVVTGAEVTGKYVPVIRINYKLEDRLHEDKKNKSKTYDGTDKVTQFIESFRAKAIIENIQKEIALAAA